MKLRTLMLGSAVGTLLFAAPALAAPDNYYNTNPTPSERAQTGALNNNAATDARTAADQNAANQADYNRNRADYEANRDAYDAERAAYERARARYNMDRNTFAHRWDAFYGYSRFRDVAAMSERNLMGLRVSSRGGVFIGRIRDVDSNRFGRVTRVAVGLGGGRTAWIDADELRYDPRGSQLVTFLSSTQVDDIARMRYPRF